jgi:hypothetical protein
MPNCSSVSSEILLPQADERHVEAARVEARDHPREQPLHAVHARPFPPQVVADVDDVQRALGMGVRRVQITKVRRVSRGQLRGRVSGLSTPDVPREHSGADGVRPSCADIASRFVMHLCTLHPAATRTLPGTTPPSGGGLPPGPPAARVAQLRARAGGVERAALGIEVHATTVERRLDAKRHAHQLAQQARVQKGHTGQWMRGGFTPNSLATRATSSSSVV